MKTLELMNRAFPKGHVDIINKFTGNIKYLIIGSPRSGTGYMSSIFNAAGIACGHEGIFSLSSRIDSEVPKGLCAESSWLATHFVDYIREKSSKVKVIHVVRDPALTLKSLLGTGFYNGSGNIARYRRFAFQVDESVKESIQQFIINWNEEAARVADYTHYLHEPDEKLFQHIGIDIQNPKPISKNINKSNSPFRDGIKQYTQILELSNMYNNKEKLYGTN
jgi:hypothetical protein